MDGQPVKPGMGKEDIDTWDWNFPQEKVIFAENVGFHQEKGFHEMCRKEINAIIYLLPENHTDKVQPIDAGF